MDELGFAYHSFDGAYWMDQLGIELTQAEWSGFEKACLEVHAMGIEIVSEACRKGDFSAWKIGLLACDMISRSWERKDPSVYGRFDLTIDEHGAPKIYEYNADTPTSIMEASRAQTDWATARGLRSACLLAELMPAAFSRIAELGGSSLAIAGISTSVEDTANLFPMVDWARQAGLDASWRPIDEMQYDFGTKLHGFGGENFEWIFKLFPWEHFALESLPGSQYLRETRTRFVEPAWKLLLSSKAFLAEAWRLYPGHPNLLPCYFEGQEGPGLERGFAKKPLYSREGANVVLTGADGKLIQLETGPYGREGFIRQAYCAMPEPEPGKRFTLGGWIAGDSYAGSCARFTDDHIVTNVSWTCGCSVA
jgi:glutathionylspermidine synthase